MKIAFSSAPSGKAGSDDYKQVGDFNNGAVQWAPTDANGHVPTDPQTMLSVQPTGVYETRPLGAPGDFEKFKFDGSALTIRPNSGGFGGPQIGYVIPARAL